MNSVTKLYFDSADRSLAEVETKGDNARKTYVFLNDFARGTQFVWGNLLRASSNRINEQELGDRAVAGINTIADEPLNAEDKLSIKKDMKEFTLRLRELLEKNHSGFKVVGHSVEWLKQGDYQPDWPFVTELLIAGGVSAMEVYRQSYATLL